MDRSNFFVHSQANITEWGNVGVVLQIDAKSVGCHNNTSTACARLVSCKQTISKNYLFLTHRELIK